jgi:hypothetical protein
MHPLLLRFLQGTLSIKSLARYSVARPPPVMEARGFAHPPHDGVALLAALLEQEAPTLL